MGGALVAAKGQCPLILTAVAAVMAVKFPDQLAKVQRWEFSSGTVRRCCPDAVCTQRTSRRAYALLCRINAFGRSNRQYAFFHTSRAGKGNGDGIAPRVCEPSFAGASGAGLLHRLLPRAVGPAAFFLNWGNDVRLDRRRGTSCEWRIQDG